MWEIVQEVAYSTGNDFDKSTRFGIRIRQPLFAKMQARTRKRWYRSCPGCFLICLSALLKLLLAELEGIELVVATLLVEKLLVGALLHDLAVGQQDDVVCVLDGA